MVLTISKRFRKADRSRIAKVGRHWIWDEFSKQDAETNLRTVFDNLPEAYAQVLQNNFPTLGVELNTIIPLFAFSSLSLYALVSLVLPK